MELSLRRRTPERWTIDVPVAPTEVAQRTASRTSKQGHRWYLNPANAGQPPPLFRGTVTGEHMHVARSASTLGRNSFVACLDADLSALPSGGTRLHGSVGLDSSWSFLWPWLVFGNVVVFGGSFAFAIHHLLGSRPFTALPLVIIPVIAITGEVLALLAGLRSMRTEATKLKAELANFLG